MPLAQIVVSTRRIRRDVAEVGLLAASLHETGLLAPPTVYERAGQYHLIAGERRLRAAQQLGASEIDVLVRPLGSDEDPYVLELVENTQRAQLTDEEEADAFIALVRDRGWELQQVADLAGRSVSHISRRIRIFEDPHLRELVTRGALPLGHAEVLVALDAAQRQRLAQQAVAEGWTQLQLRHALRALQAPAEETAVEVVTTELPPPSPTRPWATAPTTGIAPGPAADYLDGEFTEHDEPEAAESERIPATTATVPDQRPQPTATEEPDLPAGLRIQVERPADLPQQIRQLRQLLEQLKPFQLQPHDDDELRLLFLVLQRLAQAPRERKIALPDFTLAEALAKRKYGLTMPLKA